MCLKWQCADVSSWCPEFKPQYHPKSKKETFLLRNSFSWLIFGLIGIIFFCYLINFLTFSHSSNLWFFFSDFENTFGYICRFCICSQSAIYLKPLGKNCVFTKHVQTLFCYYFLSSTVQQLFTWYLHYNRHCKSPKDDFKGLGGYMRGLRVITVPFYIRGLSTCGFLCMWGSSTRTSPYGHLGAAIQEKY
jgi:hypothetical protein